MPRKVLSHAERDPKRANHFRHEYALEHYAQLFEVPYTTILTWYRKKMALDDPKKLLEQIEAGPQRKRANLTRITELATQKGSKRATKSEKNAAKNAVKEVRVDIPQFVDEAPLDSRKDLPADPLEATLTGFQLEMHRLKIETNQAYKNYMKEPNSILRKAHWSIWQEMLEAWGKLAKLAPQAEKDAKSVAKISDVEATWVRTMKEMRTSLESMARRLSSHPTFRKLNPVDVEQTIMADVNKVMTELEGVS